jgi:predicted membrane protein
MLSLLHARLADTAMYFALALAIWGFFRFFRGQGVDGSYLGAVVIGEVLMVVQGLLGGILLAVGFRPMNTSIHVLYGVLAVISFPAFYAFVQGRDSRREMLMWALLALFVFGITIRAREVA